MKMSSPRLRLQVETDRCEKVLWSVHVKVRTVRVTSSVRGCRNVQPSGTAENPADTLLYSSVETPAGVYVGAMEMSAAVNDVENEI